MLLLLAFANKNTLYLHTLHLNGFHRSEKETSKFKIYISMRHRFITQKVSKHYLEDSTAATFVCNSVACFFQLEQAEETTERRRMLECEKISTEELQMRYKVTIPFIS